MNIFNPPDSLGIRDFPQISLGRRQICMPKNLKIGFMSSVPEGWNDKTDLHPDCKNAVEDAAKLCENLGHTVEEINPNLLGYQNITDNFSIVFLNQSIYNV